MPIVRLQGRWRKKHDAVCNSGPTFPICQAPHLPIEFHSEQHQLGGVIEFLIDTGADITIIMPVDRQTIVIPARVLDEGCPDFLGGIGGVLKVKYLHDVTLRFRDAEGNRTSALLFPRIGVACPPKAQLQTYMNAPSLLGRDFLSLGKLETSDEGVFFLYEFEEPEESEETEQPDE